MKRVTKAIFPAAGMGTRFLPATKANPKEMLPIVDKPLIQYAAEEAAAAGITDLIFIIGRTKRAIADHFDKAYELEVELETRGKLKALEDLRGMLPVNVNCIYIRQAEALGLGHAVLCAQPAVNDEPFAVLLADDLIDGEPGATKQMCDLYSYYQCSMVGGSSTWIRRRPVPTASSPPRPWRSAFPASTRSWRSPSPPTRPRTWRWSAATC
jgi:UTP--glucose-1-phosphate uridylyltransferase